MHLALGTALYASVAFTSYSEPADFGYLFWLGLATWYVYLQAPYWKVPWWKFASLSETLTGSNVSAIALIVLGLIALQKIEIAFLLVLLSVLVTYLYFFGLKKSGLPWKENKLLKVVSLAVVFSILTATIPLVLVKASAASVLQMTLPRTLFFLALAMISEQREMPQASKHSRWYLRSVTFVLFISGLLDVMNASEFLLPFPVFVAYLLTNIATWCTMWLSLRNRKAWFYALIVDGLLFLPWVVILAA